MDRGAGLSRRTVAAAVPLVLRHAAGDVEAPGRLGPGRPGRQARPPWADLPAALPGPAAVAGARGGRVRHLRTRLPQPGPGRPGVGRIPGPAVLYGRLRVPAGR